MQQMNRACSTLRDAGIDIALLSSHESIAYVSGFDVPLPIGASTDFSGGYPLALVLVNAKEEYAVLICVDTFKGLAEHDSLLNNKIYFQAFDSFNDMDPQKNYINCVWGALKNAGIQSGHTLGIEYNTLPSVLYDMILANGIKTVSTQPAMGKARSVKTCHEIEILKKAAKAADAGQKALLTLSERAGHSEFEIWAKVFEEISKEIGMPAVITGELVTGKRTGVVQYPGGPIPRIIEAGDTGIMDISVRVNGYWCDCCNTVFFAKEPGNEQRRYYELSKSAFEKACETIRPGIRACDVYYEMEKVYQKNNLPMPHYGGHQIGTTVNEKPRIVPYDTSFIEAGMVFCFEPGAYSGAGGTTGARLEKVVFVEDSGAVILNQFSWGLD